MKRRFLIEGFNVAAFRTGNGGRETRNGFYGFPVTVAEGLHPFPSRTRKLSPPAPMVLRWQRRGRVCRRRIKISLKFGVLSLKLNSELQT